MQQYIVIAVLTVLLSVTAYAGNKAQDFTLQDLNGKRVTLSKQLEKGPVLLDFWATWCKPCLKELPHINEIHKKYAGKGLQVYSITIDNAKSQSRVKPLIMGKKYEFEVLLDTDSEVIKLYGGKYPPITVLIDQSGEIIYNKFGYTAGDEIKLEEEVAKLFNTKSDHPEEKEVSSEE